MRLAESIGLDVALRAVDSECVCADILNDLDDPRTEMCMPPLVKAADAFNRAGGAMSLAEWASLTKAERVACVAAGDKAAIKQAILIGRSARGSGEIYELATQIDGGRLYDEDLFDAAVKVCAKKFNNIVVPI